MKALFISLALLFGLMLPANAANNAVPQHLIIIFMENHSASQVIGNPNMPYLNSFYTQGVLFTNYKEGNSRGPSLPDYLQVAAGSSCGKTGDRVSAGDQSIANAGCTTTVWNQLNDAGVSWGVYEDAMPAPCSPKKDYANVPLDTPYALRHNPATPFPSVFNNQAMCTSHVLPYTSFDVNNLPAVSFITPGTCNDQHGEDSGNPYTDCVTDTPANLRRGDTWLANRVPAMLASGATVFITYDEDSRLYAAMVGPTIMPGTTDANAYTHYSTLAGIENAYGLSLLHKAATANPLPL